MDLANQTVYIYWEQVIFNKLCILVLMLWFNEHIIKNRRQSVRYAEQDQY
ncbi:hypothetical protein SAMN06273570_4873 [Candidatus Pantoea floridensis]|uniref:Uncharacterized protein n=1 Tax=Candidatus Pantoea floridensis TaxID=1938870 RepID=A0A286DQC5_9GAMM|nr:hypothetical protein BX596_4023 [Enterobacteriaceae bacterium JKS000233]SOD60850.1 hypothetical protein SAMN06273570_4873 [Pantoea floridensis]